MLTWGAFSIIGSSQETREQFTASQHELVDWTRTTIDNLGVETDGNGWRGRAYLYCAEARCPSTGWMVPLLPSRIIGIDDGAIADLIPNPDTKRYDITIRTGASAAELSGARTGTIVRDGRYGEAYMAHRVDGKDYRVKVSTLRGDYQRADGTAANRLRVWGKLDFEPHPEDLLQEAAPAHGRSQRCSRCVR